MARNRKIQYVVIGSTGDEYDMGGMTGGGYQGQGLLGMADSTACNIIPNSYLLFFVTP